MSSLLLFAARLAFMCAQERQITCAKYAQCLHRHQTPPHSVGDRVVIGDCAELVVADIAHNDALGLRVTFAAVASTIARNYGTSGGCRHRRVLV